MSAAEAKGAARPLHKTVIALLIAASIALLLAAFAVWADRQLLETDTWVETSTNLLEDEDVKDALAPALVDALFENVDVEGEIEQALPEEVKGLAGPVTGGVRELANTVAREALDTGVLEGLWEEANRTAHGAFLVIVEGGDETISTEGGVVTLNLSPIVEEVGNLTGIDVFGQIPEDAAQIEILRSDELDAVQTGADVLQTLSWILVGVTLGLYALAIFLAKGWRREALRAAGWWFIVVGVVVLVLRAVLGEVVVDSLAATEAGRPAVSSVWSIGTSALEAIAVGLIYYGVLAVIGAFLAGRTSVATELRRSITPALRDRWVAYGIGAAIIILVFLLSPAEGTERLGPSLILIVLLIIGLELLRRQALREFPGETWDATTGRWGERFGREGGDDGRISLARATAAQLETIEGVGPATAKAIIRFRDLSGGVAIDELDDVSGVGAETLESLKASLKP